MVRHYDPVYGKTLEFHDEEEEIISSQEFQHARKKKQLGLVNRIFPMSQNDRFAHQLGAGYLARLIARHFRLSKQDRLLVTAGGLLHDNGHYAGSHSLERIARTLLGMPEHEENGIEMILGQRSLPGAHYGPKIHDVLSEYAQSGIGPERVAALLRGGQNNGLPPFYHEIISNAAGDCDRIDYMLRDGQSATKIGTAIEWERIVENFMIKPGKKGKEDGHLGIHERGLEAMRTVIFGRRQMYETVYFHGLTMKAETMLRKAVELSIDVAKPLMWGDEVLFERLVTMGTPKSRELMLRIDGGYKALYDEALSVDARHLAYAPEAYSDEERALAEKVLRLQMSSKDIERDLLRRTGLEDGDVLVSFAKAKEKELPYFPVQLRNGRWMNIFSIPAVAEEYKEQSKLTNFGVYAARENVKKVKAAALEFLAEQP